VDRYGTMDLVSINFILPVGVLKGTRGLEIADELQALIAQKGLGNGHVTHHHPDGWAGVRGGGPYDVSRFHQIGENRAE
jgi:hypothetical protein